MNTLEAASTLSSPVDFAEHFSEGKWLRTRHQELIGDAIAEAVFAKELSILIIECPPQHGKSSVVSQWTPAWFLSVWPEKNVGVVSYEAGVATRWSRWVRDTLISIGTVPLKHDSKAADEWGTQAGGGMIATGVGGPLTSRSIHLMVIDDPIKNSEEADSETIREKLWDYFQTTVWTRKQPGTVFVIMHTRWHQSDLVGKILDTPEMARLVRRIRLPALAEENDALGRKPGEALWPERYPADMTPDGLLTTKAILKPRWFSALYQQEPSSQEGAEIKRQHWAWYDELPVPMERMDQVVISWDCAFKGTDTSDFVVGQVWCIYGSYRYLVDQIRDRMDFLATLHAVKSLNDKWKPTITLVEEKANGDAVMSAFREVIPAMIPINPKTSKVARARAVAPQIEAGQVFLPRGKKFADELVEEAAAFPLGKNDDMVDAMSQALEHSRHLKTTHLHEFGGSDDRFVNPNQPSLQVKAKLQSLIPKLRFG